MGREMLAVLTICIALASSLAFPQEHQQTYDEPEQMNVKPKQTYDESQQTYDEPQQTYDEPEHSYDESQQSHDESQQTGTMSSASNPQEPKETYDTSNDNFDIEGVLNDPVKLDRFAGCFLDRNECDQAAADFKRDLPDAVATACAKCSDAQKHMMNRFITGLGLQRHQDLVAIMKRYDPEGQYHDALAKALVGY